MLKPRKLKHIPGLRPGMQHWVKAQIITPLNNRLQMNLVPWRKYIKPLRFVSLTKDRAGMPLLTLYHKKADEVRETYGKHIQARVSGITVILTDVCPDKE